MEDEEIKNIKHKELSDAFGKLAIQQEIYHNMSLGVVNLVKELQQFDEGVELRDNVESGAVPTFYCEHVGIQLTFKCPICQVQHWHGDTKGHRISHCECWKGGYYIARERRHYSNPSKISHV